MSRENLINTITRKLHNIFDNKYGDQFLKIGLDISKINKIVTTKIQNTSNSFLNMHRLTVVHQCFFKCVFKDFAAKRRFF